MPNLNFSQPTNQFNGTTVLHKNAAGEVVKVVKTVDGKSYEKTLGVTDTTITSTQTISAYTAI